METVKISMLNPDPKNARMHDKNQIKALAESLTRFGQRRPIVVQKKGMVVRAGNGLLDAAKQLGWTEVQALVCDDTDKEAIAYALADNQLGDMSQWDDDILADQLREIGESNMVGLGFGQDDIDRLLGEVSGLQFTERGENDWEAEWWGMPEYHQEDARPQHKITMNFATTEDLLDFAKRLGIKVTESTVSAWYPPQTVDKPKTYLYVDGGEPMRPKYPIYIPSKGRWETSHTAKRLMEMGVDFRVVVEQTEEEQYTSALGKDRLLVLPFHDLGQGSIPARNWIWEHAKEHGHDRHWIIDDNIIRFLRLNNNRRLPIRTCACFCAIEDYTDRYENVAFSGLQYLSFAPDREPGLAATAFNTRIYSMTLINTALPYRWRGRYNEDTDICLRAMKDGWSTVLFNAFLGDKATTQTVKGGNTDNVYNTCDHRREFAESLQKQHPDVVKVVWKYERWHHQVDYTPFKMNKLKMKPGIVPTGGTDEYGMKLIRVNKTDDRTLAQRIADDPLDEPYPFEE